MDSLTIILLVMFLFSLLLIAIGLITRWTGGLFFSRSPERFIKDKNDPICQSERQAGIRLSNILLKYEPPITIALVILICLKLFRII